MTVISSLIESARMECGLTQAELATLASTKQPAIARIESGANKPSLRNVQHLLAIMGKSLKFKAAPLDPLESGVDSSLIYENLELSPRDRLLKLESACRSMLKLKKAAGQTHG